MNWIVNSPNNWIIQKYKYFVSFVVKRCYIMLQCITHSPVQN